MSEVVTAVIAPVVPAIVAAIIGALVIVVVIGRVIIGAVVVGVAIIIATIVCAVAILLVLGLPVILGPRCAHLLLVELRAEIATTTKVPHAAAKVAHATEVAATKTATEMPAATTRFRVRDQCECAKRSGCGQRKSRAADHEFPPGS